MQQFDFLKGATVLLKMLEMVATLVRSQPAQVPDPDDVMLDFEKDLPMEYRQVCTGNLVFSHFPDGRVRTENPESGVIQEESPDGSLSVSLPNGKLIRQRYQGEPLVVLDLENPAPPVLGRVASLNIEGEPSLVYVFEEPANGRMHLVELSTLRYFRSCKAA